MQNIWHHLAGIHATTYIQVTPAIRNTVLYLHCTPVKIKRQARWVAEKGLCRARDETTICKAAMDPMDCC